MDVIRCSVKAGLNFRGTKLSRMAVEPRKPRKFSTAKIKVHTVRIVVLVIIVNSVCIKGNSLYRPIYEYVDNTCAMSLCVELNFMSYMLQIQRLYIYKETLKAVLHIIMWYTRYFSYLYFVIWFKPANKSIYVIATVAKADRFQTFGLNLGRLSVENRLLQK